MWRLMFFLVTPLWGEDVFTEEKDFGYLERRLDDSRVLGDVEVRGKVENSRIREGLGIVTNISAARVEAAGRAGVFWVGRARSGRARVERFQRVLLSSHRENGRGHRGRFTAGFWRGSSIRAREE